MACRPGVSGEGTAALRAFDAACQAITATMEATGLDTKYIVGPLRTYYERAAAGEPDDPVLKQILEKMASLPAKK